MENDGVLRLGSIKAEGRQLSMHFSFDDYQFSTTYWYDFNLNSLRAAYGSRFLEMVYFHCAAFEINKFCSLKPSRLDWGEYAHWHTEEFEKIWNIVVHKSGAQWRYENDLPHWKTPIFASKPVLSSTMPNPVEVSCSGEPEGSKTLAFFAGGKDSLVVMNLLAEANIPHSTLTYSHSVYGQGAIQHRMSDKVLDHFSPAARHRLWMLEDFLESPVLDSLGKQRGISSIHAAETPASVFAAIPILLHYNYTQVAVGHERSANVGNFTWEATGEQVNHQWGKSLECEMLLDAYIRRVLIANSRYYSVLQPINDVVIFNIAKKSSNIIPLTNSCNLSKPWCHRCPKCCYVLMCFKAYMPHDKIDSLYHGENIFDIAENQVYFRGMLGLGENKPFECIGEVDEARLAFELCRRRGVQGLAMEMYKNEFGLTKSPSYFIELIDKYTNTTTAECDSNIPQEYRDRLLTILQQAGESASQDLKAILQQAAN